MITTHEKEQLIESLRQAFEITVKEQTGINIKAFYKIEEAVKQKIEPFDVIDIVCQTLNINVSDIYSKTRKRNISEARQICMYLVYNECLLSLHQVGRIFNRDHSTIIHGRRNIANWLRYEDDFKKKFTKVELAILEHQKSIS